MNNAKAKFILRSYRCDGADANDPVFREALAQAVHDPSLSDWFQTERAADDAIRSKLSEVPVPRDLIEDILASETLTTTRSFWRHGGRWLALAALFMALLGGVMMFAPARQPDLGFETFPRMASSFVSRPFQLDYEAASLDEATTWLQARQASWDIPVSDAMHTATSGGVGCRPIDWKGQEVFLFCFFLEDGNVVHFFMMDADALPDAPLNEAPMWARHGKYMTATWADERHAYVLAGDAEIGDLQALL